MAIDKSGSNWIAWECREFGVSIFVEILAPEAADKVVSQDRPVDPSGGVDFGGTKAMTVATLEAIKAKLSERYVSSEPYSTYVTDCGVSRVGLIDPNAGPQEKDQYCLVLLLKEPAPDGLDLPDRFEGMKVFSEVVPSLTRAF